MTFQQLSAVALYVIGSVGLSGIIVAGLSSWLGKVWANRIMASETQQHAKDLASLRADLEKANQIAFEELKHRQAQSVEWLKSDLDIFKSKHMQGFNDKLGCYRELVNLVADTLAMLDSYFGTGKDLTQEFLAESNRQRLRIYGLTAMIAPQHVMDAQDVLIDHLLEVVEGSQPYEWEVVRKHSISLINEIRKDIGVDVSPIDYKGKR